MSDNLDLSPYTKKQIISISRRTDIPAFFCDWLAIQLKKGYVDVVHPFIRKIERISLKPNDVAGFVFWSRYPIGLIKYINLIEDIVEKNHYLNLTITNYPSPLENFKPNLSRVLNLTDFFAERYGKKYIRWRFDPIIITNITPESFIIENFHFLCEKLSEKTDSCITSFVDLYPKVIKKLKTYDNLKLSNISNHKQIEIITQLDKIAKSFGIKLELCCESKISKQLGISNASCVKPTHFYNINLEDYKIKPSRNECTCYESIDIGFYNSCIFNCVYCYTTTSNKTALKNYLNIKRKIKIS
ncbi:MAG: DUF1848 domain-containing protein [Ignavibacteria bacterium]|nr:DUF1848 domain-containing protein [Ignavibacteria bacterium]